MHRPVLSFSGETRLIMTCAVTGGGGMDWIDLWCWCGWSERVQLRGPGDDARVEGVIRNHEWGVTGERYARGLGINERVWSSVEPAHWDSIATTFKACQDEHGVVPALLNAEDASRALVWVDANVERASRVAQAWMCELVLSANDIWRRHQALQT